MKAAIAQFSPVLGDVGRNIELHLDFIERAKKEKIELLLFPELSLTGYSLKDLVHETAIDPIKSRTFDEFASISRDISFALGFVEEKEKGLFYNSSAFFSQGKNSQIHRKVYLPTYGMFEEAKFYAQGRNFITYSTPFGNAGMMICYDFLHYGACYLLFSGGAEMIFVLSAAPGRGMTDEDAFATSHMWELMGETISRFSSCFVFYANRSGFEEGVSFAGGSFIYNPAGKLLAKAKYADDDFLVCDINLDEIGEMRRKLPYRRDNKPEIILQALKRIVNRYED